MRNGKRTPQQRWLEHNTDAFDRLRHSADYSRLKIRGLGLLGRSTQIRIREWLPLVVRVLKESPEGWQLFQQECEVVGAFYGLDGHTVELGCLIAHFRPEQGAFPIAASEPVRTLVVNVDTDSPFFTNVLHHAVDLHVTVSSKIGSFSPAPRGVLLLPDNKIVAQYPVWPETEIADDERPPLATVFKMRVEFPPMYPPELAVEWTREAMRVQNELARRLGYSVPERLRRQNVSLRD